MRVRFMLLALGLTGCGGAATLPLTPDGGAPGVEPGVCLEGASYCGETCIASSASPVACDACTAVCADGPLTSVSLCHQDSCKSLLQRVLEETNRVRADGADCGVHGAFGPAEPLALQGQLTEAAQGHSEDMAGRGFLGHTGSDGSSLAQRVARSGYSVSGTSVGENVAMGYPSAERVVRGWLGSDGHCRNLMNADFRSLGVGIARADGGPLYWTQVFGGR